jgi:hypothetical protein
MSDFFVVADLLVDGDCQARHGYLQGVVRNELSALQ